LVAVEVPEPLTVVEAGITLFCLLLPLPAVVAVVVTSLVRVLLVVLAVVLAPTQALLLVVAVRQTKALLVEPVQLRPHLAALAAAVHLLLVAQTQLVMVVTAVTAFHHLLLGLP
jgi:hypothetical protein